MLRNELEYRNSKRQIEELRSELDKRRLIVERDVSQSTNAVSDALKMKIGDIESEIEEYEALREGRIPALNIDSFDDIGKLVTKARIARGWSQADLAEALDMEPQQVQRYERNDWQKISLWRLQEVVEAINLDVYVRARLLALANLETRPESKTRSSLESRTATWTGELHQGDRPLRTKSPSLLTV